MTTIDNENVGTSDVEPTRGKVLDKITNAPTATLSAIIALILTGGTLANVDLSYTLITAGVLVAASVVSAIWPRWAGSRGIFFRHPALLTGYLVTILTAAAPLAGIHPTEEQAGIIITGTMAIVGLAFPRDGFPDWWLRLFGEPHDADSEVAELERDRLGE